jgi:hypothetical protein
MTDLNLLLFGCVVSFIAAAGAYIYLRECFTEGEPPREARARSAHAAEQRLRDVA